MYYRPRLPRPFRHRRRRRRKRRPLRRLNAAQTLRGSSHKPCFISNDGNFRAPDIRSLFVHVRSSSRYHVQRWKPVAQGRFLLQEILTVLGSAGVDPIGAVHTCTVLCDRGFMHNILAKSDGNKFMQDKPKRALYRFYVDDPFT